MGKYEELRDLVLEFHEKLYNVAISPPFSNTNEKTEASYWLIELERVINILKLKHDKEVDKQETPIWLEGYTSKKNENGKWVIEDTIMLGSDGITRRIDPKYIGKEIDNHLFRYPVLKSELEEPKSITRDGHSTETYTGC